MAKKIKNIKKYHRKKVRVDPLYKSFWFAKLINKLMLNGNKPVVEKIVAKSFQRIKRKWRRQPIKLLFLILMKIKPVLGFISKRLGKEWKKVPVPLQPRRQLVVALKWLVAHAKTAPASTLEARLFRIFLQLWKKKRNALNRRRDEYHYDLGKARVNNRFRWK